MENLKIIIVQKFIYTFTMVNNLTYLKMMVNGSSLNSSLKVSNKCFIFLKQLTEYFVIQLYHTNLY